MQHSIEKFLFLTLLGIFLFSFPGYLIASETADDRLLTSQASGEHNPAQQTASNVTFQSKRDISVLLFGINMAAIGLLAVALSLYRWKANDLSLISFGIFCFIYGARSGAFQYLVSGCRCFRSWCAGIAH
jgi:hypothetical protein